MPAAKKTVAKTKPKATPKSRAAQKKNMSLVSRTPKFNLIVVAIVVSLVLLVAVVYLFVSQASTARYNALQPVKAGSAAGAKLPISYAPSALTGTVRYAAPNGSNTSGCTASDPCTLARAVSQTTAANSTIVLAGGLYRDQANISISGSGRNGLKLIAASGQIPEIRGSVVVSGGWVTEGSYKYISYMPRPVELSQGVHFETLSDMTNLTGDGSGRYADQAWIGNTALDQVAAKSSLADGKFFVDQANNRLYMTAADASRGEIEISRPGDGTTSPRDRAFSISSSGVTLEGVRINRYSANGDDYGVILLNDGAHNFTMRQSELTDAPYEGVHVGLVDNPTFKNVTMSNVAWQTINANQSDKLLLDKVKITSTDPFDEFSSSPASGALKTSRTRDSKIMSSYIVNNKSHGLWFDQSNINVVVDKNFIKDNSGAGVFFEISDGLTMTNNYIAATTGQAVKLAGSSGLRLVNNTIVGGYDPIGVYVDGRSAAGCITNVSLCKSTSLTGDRQGRFASSAGATMDWMPRIDVMVNNIIAYPVTNQKSAICGKTVSVGTCITTNWNGTTVVVPLETIIHKADAARGIPQTIIDGNVYANGSTRIIQAGSSNYTTITAWTSAIAGPPVNISGIDSRGKSGNSWVNTDGTGTDSLVSTNKDAYKIPAYTGTNAIINTYIPAGTQQYGALSDATSTPTTSPTTTTTTTTTPSPTPDATAPTGPSSLSASATSTSQVNLSWPAATDNVGVSSYVLTRNGTQIYTGTALNFSDTGLTASTSYTYKVIAKDAVGNPSTGATATGTTQAAPSPSPSTTPTPTADTAKPSQPTNATGKIEFDALKFTYFTNLNWSPSYDNSGVTSYEVRRNNESFGTSTTASFKDYSLQPNILYTYDIYARDATGNVSAPATTRLTGRCFLIWCWSE